MCGVPPYEAQAKVWEAYYKHRDAYLRKVREEHGEAAYIQAMKEEVESLQAMRKTSRASYRGAFSESDYQAAIGFGFGALIGSMWD